MVSSFEKMWGRKKAGGGLGLRDRLRFLVRNVSIREKLVKMRRTLDKDVRYLETELSRFRALEKSLVSKLKKAVAGGEKAIAGVLSNELANLKRIIDIMDKIKAAFEQISMRIGLMLRVGDVATTVAEIRPVIKRITPLVGMMVPQFLNDVHQVDEALDELMSETEMDIGGMLPTEPMSEDARKMLEALELAVKHEDELSLPEEPASITPRVRRVRGGS